MNRGKAMKQFKPELLLVTIVLIFFAFAGGFYLGSQNRSDENGIQVSRRSALPSSDASAQESSAPQETVVQTDGLLNINTASRTELTGLPGIGETIAQRIIDYREAHGGFSSIEELEQVSGIGSKRLDAIRDYITVGDEYENSDR